MSRTLERAFDLRSLLPGEYYCAGCAERVCERARTVDGVTTVSCDLEEGVLSVGLDTRLLAESDLEPLVRRLVLEETGRVGHVAYRLTGLD
ncbi:MAG: hypothetical protein ISP10_08390 [Aeromicrobium sp.]|nr:hypothetical protein [Aeromicrobium sp.]